MKIFLDCLPCTLKQVLEASKLSTDNVDIQKEIMENSILVLAGYKKYKNAHELANAMHKVVKDISGNNDPF